MALPLLLLALLQHGRTTLLSGGNCDGSGQVTCDTTWVWTLRSVQWNRGSKYAVPE